MVMIKPPAPDLTRRILRILEKGTSAGFTAAFTAGLPICLAGALAAAAIRDERGTGSGTIIEIGSRERSFLLTEM